MNTIMTRTLTVLLAAAMMAGLASCMYAQRPEDNVNRNPFAVPHYAHWSDRG